MERALICALLDPRLSDEGARAILDEMRALAQTAGAVVVGESVQRRAVPDRRALIGAGKVAELGRLADERQAETVIFFNVLNQMQQRNLEAACKRKVIDRTRLILDIFAGRARSLEGKLQVELAQLLYLLPRLTGHGVQLSRLGGGIGTRGPGETKLEADRRTIKRRITQIRARLEEVTRNREIQRRNRQSTPVPLVSLAGYTSAGKSTLFRALSGEAVTVSAQLFSTLDPLLRRVGLDEIEPGCHFLISDTVGFIRHMPDELFTSFQATLEEVVQADLVLHVVDSSAADWEVRRSEVEKVLERLEVPGERVITVFNKIDLPAAGAPPRDPGQANEVFVSAATGAGLDGLKRVIFRNHFAAFRRYELELPAGIAPESVSRWAIVTRRIRHADGWRLELLCRREDMVQFIAGHGGVCRDLKTSGRPAS